jgi:hypothetical protein
MLAAYPILDDMCKLIATLKAIDVLNCDKPGKYHVTKHKVRQQQGFCLFINYKRKRFLKTVDFQ